jgi:hypothetical protein
VSAAAQPYRDSTEHTQCSPAHFVIFVSAIFWSVTATLGRDDQRSASSVEMRNGEPCFPKEQGSPFLRGTS